MHFSFISSIIKYIKLNWIPIILLILSIYDLRVDFRLLADFFTFSSLVYTLSDNPLAITVLITAPSFLKKNNIR
tara:strand:- start:258 stop:479 length:222 start_codon:yes stop_codon:yes gene_type:complete